MSDRVQGPAFYFPSIEKKYGKRGYRATTGVCYAGPKRRSATSAHLCRRPRALSLTGQRRRRIGLIRGRSRHRLREDSNINPVVPCSPYVRGEHQRLAYIGDAELAVILDAAITGGQLTVIEAIRESASPRQTWTASRRGLRPPRPR